MSVVEERLDSARERIVNELPSEINVTEVQYEGPELVVYTSDPEEFTHQGELIQELAINLQKRITIRPDPNIRIEKRKAEDTILSIVPENAGITNIAFQDDTGEVLVEAQKPGMVIGHGGTTLTEISTTIGWTAEVLRTPPIDSSTVDNVRNYLKQERGERREILQRVGRRIHQEPRHKDEDYVRVTTLGCCREVGRAAFILSTPETRILVDCGDKPGSDDYPYLEAPEALGSGPSTFDAVVLTHAHLDHSALIPLLYKYGYDGPIYCTEPTRDLMGLLTLDYLDVAGKEGRTPPYESEQVREALKHTITVGYGEVSDIAPDIRLTFQNAGHILGSAVSHFNIGEGRHNIVFSGDIHYEDTRLFNGAVNNFPECDALVMESTYGGRNDYATDQIDAEDQLKDVITRTYQRGGKVLIPAFAVGRSQEIMLVLEKAMRDGEIPRMPIHLDGMIFEATAIHATYPEYLLDEVRSRIIQQDQNPFLADEFNYIDGHEDERQSIRDGGPCIILSTSGMVTGGPIMSWLNHVGPDPDSAMVFVGYQAQGTLGRRIQNGRGEIPMDDQGRGGNDGRRSLKLNIAVETVDGFSGHGDRGELMDFVGDMESKPDNILCVHGDEQSTGDLSSGLYHEYGIRTFAPQNLETFRFQ